MGSTSRLSINVWGNPLQNMVVASVSQRRIRHSEVLSGFHYSTTDCYGNPSKWQHRTLGSKNMRYILCAEKFVVSQ